MAMALLSVVAVHAKKDVEIRRYEPCRETACDDT